MHCPNCGAENDAEARFCAECGAPLEDQTDIEATVAGRVFEEAGDDMTIMSTASEVAEQAKTVTVDQSQLAAVAEEADTASTTEPEPEPSPPPASSAPPAASTGPIDTGEGAGDESKKRLMIIIGIIVVLFLCCCCCSLAIGGAIGSDPDAFEDLMREITLISTYLPFV
jgi:cobalamin biosynthesis Mg chelatase CobN